MLQLPSTKINLQLLQIHKQNKKRPYNNKTHKSQSTRVYKNSISPSSLQWLQCTLARWSRGHISPSSLQWLQCTLARWSSGHISPSCLQWLQCTLARWSSGHISPSCLQWLQCSLARWSSGHISPSSLQWLQCTLARWSSGHISPSCLQWLQCSLARWSSGRLPCKHARSDPHPSVSLEALARSGPDDSCTLACLQTGSVWAKPDTAGTQLDPGWFCTVWSRPATECERGNLEAGRLHSARNGAQWFFHFSLLPDKVHLPKTWPGHPDRTPD